MRQKTTKVSATNVVEEGYFHTGNSGVTIRIIETIDEYLYHDGRRDDRPSRYYTYRLETQHGAHGTYSRVSTPLGCPAMIDYYIEALTRAKARMLGYSDYRPEHAFEDYFVPETGLEDSNGSFERYPGRSLHRVVQRKNGMKCQEVWTPETITSTSSTESIFLGHNLVDDDGEIVAFEAYKGPKISRGGGSSHPIYPAEAVGQTVEAWKATQEKVEKGDFWKWDNGRDRAEEARRADKAKAAFFESKGLDSVTGKEPSATARDALKTFRPNSDDPNAVIDLHDRTRKLEEKIAARAAVHDATRRVDAAVKSGDPNLPEILGEYDNLMVLAGLRERKAEDTEANLSPQDKDDLTRLQVFAGVKERAEIGLMPNEGEITREFVEVGKKLKAARHAMEKRREDALREFMEIYQRERAEVDAKVAQLTEQLVSGLSGTPKERWSDASVTNFHTADQYFLGWNIVHDTGTESLDYSDEIICRTIRADELILPRPLIVESMPESGLPSMFGSITQFAMSEFGMTVSQVVESRLKALAEEAQRTTSEEQKALLQKAVEEYHYRVAQRDK